MSNDDTGNIEDGTVDTESTVDETPVVLTWWIRDNETRPIDESRSIVLQPVRDGEIVTEIGPYALEFSSNVAMRFFYQESLDDLITYLDEKYHASFGEVSLSALEETQDDAQDTDDDIDDNE